MLVKNAKMPERGKLPNTLHAIRRLNGAAIRPVGTDYKTDIGRLVKNLRDLPM